LSDAFAAEGHVHLEQGSHMVLLLANSTHIHGCDPGLGKPMFFKLAQQNQY
jgi:hypothetical protein